jgi:hypothetical protein
MSAACLANFYQPPSPYLHPLIQILDQWKGGATLMLSSFPFKGVLLSQGHYLSLNASRQTNRIDFFLPCVNVSDVSTFYLPRQRQRFSFER